MVRWGFLAGAVLAVLDLYLVYRIGHTFGVWAALALILLPAFFGAKLAYRQGRRCLAAIQDEQAAGRTPSQKLAEAPVILAAGLLMIYPGPITTVLGAILLIPGLRRAIARAVLRRMGATGGGWPAGSVSPDGGVFAYQVRAGGGGPAIIKDVQAREVDSRPGPPGASPPRELHKCDPENPQERAAGSSPCASS